MKLWEPSQQAGPMKQTWMLKMISKGEREREKERKLNPLL